MFYTRDSSTTDIATAIGWMNAGHPVSVRGWVKAYRAGKEKVCSKLSFTDIAKLYPKWKIETENVAFVQQTRDTHRRFSWQRSSQDHRANEERKRELLRQANSVLQKAGHSLDEKAIMMPKAKRKKLYKAGKLSKREMRMGFSGSYDFDRDVCRKKFSLMWNKFEKLKEEWEFLGKDTSMVKLYHGTKIENVESIFNVGFRVPWHSGMLGRGVYVGPLAKARNYSDGIILICEVMLGKCKELENPEKLEDNGLYDSMHLGSGQHRSVYKGFLRYEEWVLRSASQLRVVGVALRGSRL